MLYDLKADALTTLNRADQANRLREEAGQRLVREAMAGHKKRNATRVPRLVGWVQMLAKPEPSINPEPSS